jgi:hypothetical protein
VRHQMMFQWWHPLQFHQFRFPLRTSSDGHNSMQNKRTSLVLVSP